MYVFLYFVALGFSSLLPLLLFPFISCFWFSPQVDLSLPRRAGVRGITITFFPPTRSRGGEELPEDRQRAQGFFLPPGASRVASSGSSRPAAAFGQTSKHSSYLSSDAFC